jgi:hypothetical protein
VTSSSPGGLSDAVPGLLQACPGPRCVGGTREYPRAPHEPREVPEEGHGGGGEEAGRGLMIVGRKLYEAAAPQRSSVLSSIRHGKGFTAIGTELGVVVPSPSWPSKLLPQQ